MSFFPLFQYCLGSRKHTIGGLSSEQLLRDPSKVLSRKLKEIVCSLMNCIYRHLKLSVASSLSFLELLISMLLYVVVNGNSLSQDTHDTSLLSYLKSLLFGIFSMLKCLFFCTFFLLLGSSLRRCNMVSGATWSDYFLSFDFAQLKIIYPLAYCDY